MTSEEMYGPTNWKSITPEQRKRRRAYYVKRFEPLLKPEGFVRKGVYFLRLRDDYILQTVNLDVDRRVGFCQINADHWLTLERWRDVLYDYPDSPRIYGDISWFGALTSLEKLCEYQYPGAQCCGQPVFKITDDFEEGVEKSCQLLQERGIPSLNSVRNLEDYVKYKNRWCERYAQKVKGKYPYEVPKIWTWYTPVGALMKGDKDTALRIFRNSIQYFEKHYNSGYRYDIFLLKLEKLMDAVSRMEANDQKWMDRLVNDTVDLARKQLNKVCPKVLEAYEASHSI